MTQQVQAPIPTPVPNEDNKAFWEACKNRELKLQKCTKCSRFRYYPRLGCPYCNSLEFTWEKVSGKAKVYSWTVVYPPSLPIFQSKVPFPVVLVELAEGPRMTTSVIDVKPEELKVGMPVEVTFEDVDENITLPKFKRAGK